MVVIKTPGWITVTTVTTIIVATFGQQQQQQYYASRYDHLDITTILNNQRMVTYYANCLLSKGPCPPQGQELKHILPEALQTNCGRCSEKQKTAAYRSIKRLKKEYPKIWDQLSALWDPDGFYINRFEATFENDQIRDNEIQTTDKPIVLSNRFGDDTAEATNTISTNIPPVSPFSTTTTTSTSTSTSTTTSTSTSTRTSTATSTNRPSTVVTNTVIRPIQTRPQSPGIGANIQATVSFGSNVVHGFVKGLSDLGARVVQTGTKIADAVITAVVRP